MKTKFIVILLVLLSILSSSLFSKGAKEKSEKEKVSFSSLDLSTSSLDEIENVWNSLNEEYNQNVKALKDAMSDSYSKGDVSGYLEARNLLYSLERPVITKEMNSSLLSRIEKEEDESEKKRIATFLSENSSYYRPSIRFICEYKEGSFSSSFSSYVSGNPGDKVKAPNLSENIKSFLRGWGTKDGELLYGPDDEITIPYGEEELYAIFLKGIYFNNAYGEDLYLEGDEIEIPTPTTTREGLVFVGWYDSNGNLLEGDKLKVDNNTPKEFNALWKGVTLDAIAVETYDKKLPSSSDARVKMFFHVSGNEALKDLKISLEESENFSVKGSLTISKVTPMTYPSCSFIVNAKGKSGDVIKTKIFLEDAEGKKWEYPVEFVIR